MHTDKLKWDRRFLNLAALLASWSKDPSTQVGAVIAHPVTHRIIQSTLNGPPHGFPDDPGILEDRDAKYSCMIHAEENALLFAKESLVGMTVYTYPVPPCSRCAAKLLQMGITRVVAPSTVPADFGERWSASLEMARRIFDKRVQFDLVAVEIKNPLFDKSL